MANTPSLKRIQIDKATTTMIAVASAAVFIVIFTIISSHSLLHVLGYQNKVIGAQETAVNQLNADISASKRLGKSYAQFDNTSTNLLGAPTTGSSPNSGDNAKVILDALPSVYDYPALATSIQNLLSNQGVTIDSITGTDEQASVGSNGQVSSSSATSTSGTSTNIGNATAMPFSFSVDGPYTNLQNVINTFQRSIRPFQFETLEFSGDQSDVTMTATAQTYYQPATTFKITTETIQ